MKKTIVYIDGFNLYHAINDLGHNYLKWVNLWSLSESMLRNDEELIQVKYFTAHATWLPDAYRRHRIYIAANKENGVTTVLGKFKKKQVECKACHSVFYTHEEKETDVNVAIHLVSDGLLEKYDRAIVVSADTDLSTAINMARQLTTNKQIDAVAPPGRMSQSRVMQHLFMITTGKIRANLLPYNVPCSDGSNITVPHKYIRT